MSPASPQTPPQIPPRSSPRPAVFFDRDGVLNHDAGYTHEVAEFRWIEGAPEALRLCNTAGILVFVVTNQAGVARGYYKESAIDTLHRFMSEDLKRWDARIDDFRYCPHHPEGTVAGYGRPCQWRKPNPGMILDLAANWPVDISRSVLIGDKESDMAAARAAGLRGVLFTGGNLLSVVEPLLLDDKVKGR